MTDRLASVLFVCAGNDTLSIMAERLLDRLGKDRFRSFSAGVKPRRSVHPLTLEILQSAGLSTTGLRPKSCQPFRAFDGPSLDFVFQLTDDAASVQSFAWKGRPIIADWSQSDPGLIGGHEAAQLQGFRDSFKMLKRQIELFLSSQRQGVTRSEAARRIATIGLIGGHRQAANAA